MSMDDDFKRDGLISQLMRRIATLETFEREFRLKQFGGGGDCVMVYDNELAAPAADITIDLSTLTGYKHLEMRTYLRGEYANINDQLRVQFNGDTGNKYNYLTWYSNAVPTTGGVTGFGAAYMIAGWFAAANSPANAFSTGIFWFNNCFTTTDHKKMHFRTEDEENTAAADYWLYDGGGRWKDTAALSSIRLFTASGNNFAVGSRITIYGLK